MERSEKTKETGEQKLARVRATALREMQETRSSYSSKEQENMLDNFIAYLEEAYQNLSPTFEHSVEEYKLGLQEYSSLMMSWGIKKETVKELLHLLALKIAN